MDPLVFLITRSIKGMQKQNTKVTSGRVDYTALSLSLPFFWPWKVMVTLAWLAV